MNYRYQRFACLLLSMALLAACAIRSPQLDLEDGHLRPCPKNPNCVSSESDVDLSRVEPIVFQGDPAMALAQMKETLLYMGAHLEHESSDYLWVTFRSHILRIIDDVEVRLVAGENILHIRSGSRTGYSDMGVNRKRVKHIREHFLATHDGNVIE